MAFGQNKNDKIRTAAREARHNKAVVFTPELGTNATKWAELVTVIESEGWELAHWAVGPTGTIASVEAFPLFRAK